ncbi:hypothetical protein N864_16795 [Intrasporangium chromatireducens Q5-1]|uniref:Uncharacterized protein n=1 Tax=Intrasporangium chromatireducens Q5-1 TaxID=584657 RepID=W9GSC7_9MICO|nr:hypothetical protein [Intrasporangium chromatireducens]EWT06799.1 hypothetical protein N864_16795 [Intrasporangium chromatireducens Q5-1]
MTTRLRTLIRDAAAPLPAPYGGAGWSRRRLLSVLALLVVVVVLLLVGLGDAVYVALAPHQKAALAPRGAVATDANTPPGGIPTARGESSQDRRDRIAADPMLATQPSEAEPGPPATRLAEPITVPAASTAGPVTVPTGFPKIPEGAVGQLAAIETTVLEAMSIPVAHEVYAAWALPGGVGGDQWAMTANVQAFLAAARMGPEKDARTTVYATPAGAQVKGTDGPDWAVACVLLEVDAVIASDAKIGYGHCERMQWHEDSTAPKEIGGRWMIAPGDPPALAPSTWPGTERAIDAGWKRWLQNQPAAAAGRD